MSAFAAVTPSASNLASPFITARALKISKNLSIDSWLEAAFRRERTASGDFSLSVLAACSGAEPKLADYTINPQVGLTEL